MTTTTRTAAKCGKCDGKGRLSWTRIANGVCFVCGGSGRLVVTEAARKENAIPRSMAIAKIAALLGTYADDGSEAEYSLAYYIARTDADVAERALVAIDRMGGIRSNVERMVADEVARFGRRVVSVRRAG